MSRLACLLLVCSAACSSTSPEQKSPARGAAGSGGGDPSKHGSGGAPTLSVGGGTSQAGGTGTECASVAETAKAERRPVDIIFVIDNSDSMSEEIRAVQERINIDLAKILEDAGVDYRVIMISHSTANSMRPIPTGVCISAPLGKACPPAAADVDNPPRFYHHSVEVGSESAWCDLINFWNTPDDMGRGTGWSAHARKASFKHIVVISDDTTRCSPRGEPSGDPSEPDTIAFNSVQWSAADGWHEDAGRAEAAAKKFDARLLALSPEHFGSAGARYYKFHSIVGLAANSPATQAWEPSAPLQTKGCGGIVMNPGMSHQALSRLSGGLRYPICQFGDFGAVFRVIAEDVLVDAKLSCEWTIPPPPGGQTLNYTQVNLEYQPTETAKAEVIPKVSSADKCGSDPGWYYDRKETENPQKVVVCPATCETFKASQGAGVRIAFGCDTVVSVK